jgi:Carboxypeptidase regulatory-like domain
MSELLQTGRHPDADQLNAFTEHTLPAHEQQQTLAHLAVCPACRQIVALSLPPAAQSAPTRLELVRNRWLSRPHLAWVGMPALAAALILMIIFLRQGGLTRPQTSSPAQLANVHPPAPPPSASSSPVATPEPSTPAAANHQRSSPTPDKAVAAGKRSLAAPPDEYSKQQRAVANQPQQLAGVAGTMGGILGGIATAPLQPKAEDTATAAAPAVPENSTNLHGRSLSQVSRSVGGPIAGVSPPDSITSLSVLEPGGPQNYLSSLSPLPSHLAVLSMASLANQRLVIDTRNHLFFSDDNGQHWKAVPSQWKGRAVRVALTLGLPPAATLSVRFLPAPATVSTLSGTIKDPSGAVIPGATVAATYSSTALVRNATTDIQGQFRLENLVPGSYQIEAQAAGFETQSFTAQIESSQQAVADLTLPVGSAAQTVMVEPTPGRPGTSPGGASIAAKANRAARLPASPAMSHFELTTSDGIRWASNDGQNWKRE